MPPSLSYLYHTELISRTTDRLQILNIIPLCYWHEYLDKVHVFKSLKNDSDSNISVKVSTRETRSASTGILLNVGKCRTVNNQNSYYIRAAKVWNTQGRRKIDKWGGGGIFIYSCSQTVKTIDFKIYVTISKEINCAEHEYMNIASPPNYRSSGAPGNTLPIDIRDTTKSVPSFETLLRKHYIDLTSMSIFNSDDQRPHKFV